MMNAAVLAMVCTAAVAKVIHVPGDAPTIQAGIDLAADGDEVVVADGVYAGGGNRDIDFTGKLITVRSEHGPQQCIIDCQGTVLDPHRGVIFDRGETAAAVLEGFTIRNGFVGGVRPGQSDQGGGIRCDGASPTIASCVIVNCRAVAHGGGCCAAGGGIYAAGGTPTIVNCLISDNHANNYGGGIACASGNALVVGCTIEFNGTGDSGSAGGGIWGSVTIIGCDITGNSSSKGGGIWGPATTLNSRVLGNSATTSGGGASMRGLLANCLVARNSASGFHSFGGGGIDCSGPATITNCTVAYNTTSNMGGGILAMDGAIDLHNTIVWNNAASQGGQIAALWFPTFDPTTLTVVYCNVQQGLSDLLVGNGAQLVLGSGNVDADPMFVDPDGLDDIPGTLDDDLRLGPGSPSIDAGWNNAATFDAADLDGNPRFADDPATVDTGCGVPVVVDMGAYEHPGKAATVVFGDVNGDGALRINDLPALALCLGSDDPACCVADLDLDGAVGPSDQAALLSRLLDFISGK